MTLDALGKSASHVAFAKLSAMRMYFYQWALKWHYGNAREDQVSKPDLPIIICLLQAMGFKLREFERKSQSASIDEAGPSGSIKITMECGTSMMTAVLDMDGVKCTCQDNAEMHNGSLWSVSGTGPVDSNHLQRIEETGSNLLPDVPKETMQAIQEIIFRVIKVINAKGDVSVSEFKEGAGGNKNFVSPTMNVSSSKISRPRDGLIRSYTDIYKQPNLEIRVAESNANRLSSTRIMLNDSDNKPTRQLQRQGTYELQDVDKIEDITDEPRSPPLRISSSPVRALCSSLGQLSLQSDEEVSSLSDYVLMAHQILSSAVKFIKRKIPGNSSFNQDESGNVKPTIQQLMSSSLSVNSSFSQSSSPYFSSCNGSTCSLSNRGTSSTYSQPKQPLAQSQRTQQQQQQQQQQQPQQQPKQQQQQQQRSIPRSTPMQPRAPVGSYSGLTGPSRDRSSSFSSGQRPVFSKSVNPPMAAKRNTSLTNSTLGPRSTPTGLKLPTKSKLVQPRSTVSLAPTERSTLQTQRRVLPSSNTSFSAASSKPKEPQRANVSLIKPPSSGRAMNSTITTTASKFGFMGSKK